MVKENSIAELVEQMIALRDPAQQSALAAKALQNIDRFEQPIMWGSLNGALGAVLVGSAVGKYDEALIGEILSAYRSAISVFDPTEWPGEWLLTARNIAATHLIALSAAIGDSVEHVCSAITTYANALARGHRDRSPEIWDQCVEELGDLLGAVAGFQASQQALLRIARACEIASLVVPQGRSEKTSVALQGAFKQCLAKLGYESVKTVDHLM